MRYRAQEPPIDVARLPEFLSGELRRVEVAIAVESISASASASYAGVVVKSLPPTGGFRVLNLYMNSDKQLVVIYG